MSEMMAVIGTWPLRAPARLSADELGRELSAHDQQLETGPVGQLDDQRMGIDRQQPAGPGAGGPR